MGLCRESVSIQWPAAVLPVIRTGPEVERMTELFTLIGDAFKESIVSTFKKPFVWLILSLLTAVLYYLITYLLPYLPYDDGAALPIPATVAIWVASLLLLIVTTGVYMKPYRNEDPSFTQFGRICKDGLFATITELVYWIVPLALACFVVFGYSAWNGLMDTSDGSLIYFVGIVICWIIIIALFLLANILWFPAMTRLSKTGSLKSIFQLSVLFSMIEKVTWARCIIALIAIVLIDAVILGVIYAVSYMFMLIPVAGLYIGVIIAALLTPYIFIFSGKCTAKLFEGA